MRIKLWHGLCTCVCRTKKRKKERASSNFIYISWVYSLHAHIAYYISSISTFIPPHHQELKLFYPTSPISERGGSKAHYTYHVFWLHVKRQQHSNTQSSQSVEASSYDSTAMIMIIIIGTASTYTQFKRRANFRLFWSSSFGIN